MTANSLPTTARVDRWLLVLWIAAAAASVAIVAVSASLAAAVYGVQVALALLLALLQGASIVGALLWPRVAAAAAAVALLGFAVATPATATAPWPVSAPSIVAFSATIALVVVRGAWRPGLGAWVVAVAGVVIVGVVGGAAAGAASGVDGTATADLIVFASVSGAVLLAALLVSRWQDVRRQLVRERQTSAGELARREVAEERTRIARELHDIVAHGMSAIQVQASSAKYRIPSLPDEAVAEFDDLAATARTAMGEMRRLLGVLRSDDSGVETAPQPGVTDIPALVADAARRGRVELVGADVDTSGMDAITSLAAYRIVQESLSNVARHATDAATVVRLDRVDDSLAIEVRNAPAPGRPASPPAPDGGGHGIRGMRERAELLGGTLTAAAQPDGGFVVRAVLPLAGKNGTP
ncbi:sensor histidine kinase [Leifsonia sp. 1010]|uniref:sensor histidine kinase n=1 Tax=Leifsonia sp. 1010 TaxID=2817769 RepID=UPI002865BF36|nr:sensor histidine kinase [Leifsonia sp. 1010]MDR6611898.1 signal transduction histidine kinase [Leifsonia sp. 1010]